MLMQGWCARLQHYWCVPFLCMSVSRQEHDQPCSDSRYMLGKSKQTNIQYCKIKKRANFFRIKRKLCFSSKKKKDVLPQSRERERERDNVCMKFWLVMMNDGESVHNGIGGKQTSGEAWAINTWPVFVVQLSMRCNVSGCLPLYGTPHKLFRT